MNPLTTVKPEDKNKVIALGAAITVMFGYVGVSFARNRASASAPAPTPPAVPPAGNTAKNDAPPPGTATVQEAVPGSEEAEAKAKEGAARQRIAIPNLSDDPFSPVHIDETKYKKDRVPVSDAQTKAPPPRVKPTFVPPVLPALKATIKQAAAPPQIPMLPMGEFHPGGPGGAAGAAGTKAIVLPAPVPDVPLALAGVIRGEFNEKGAEVGAVAMIEAGNGQQFLRLWDTIEGWRLVKIASESVTLRRGKQIRILRVGAGESSAAAPAATVAAPAPAPAQPMLAPPGLPQMPPQAVPTTQAAPGTDPIVIPAAAPLPADVPAAAATTETLPNPDATAPAAETPVQGV